jgi:hypothetical protein
MTIGIVLAILTYLAILVIRVMKGLKELDD